MKQGRWIVLCAILSAFIWSCEEPKNEPFTGLRKRISVLPVQSIDFPLPGQRTVNISTGLRELLEISVSQGDRYRIDRHSPPTPPPAPLAHPFTTFDLGTALSVPTDGDLGPMTARPQYYVFIEVIAFELRSFSGTVYVGYGPGGVITNPTVRPGASVKVDVARMDLALSVLDPYRLEPVMPTQRLTQLDAQVVVAANFTFDGIPGGFELVFKQPLRLALEKLLLRGMSRIDPLMEAQPFETRIATNPPPEQGIAYLTAGLQDANITTGLNMQLLRQTFLYDRNGKFQGAYEEPYGSAVVTHAGLQGSKINWTIDKPGFVVLPDDLVRYHTPKPPQLQGVSE